ncbi:unnamed protein product [Acanthoscelides obtectus]|uniref:Uncharacterized protein n=1 Tax=Acanthoscelides obtectus TaxID=200917 RepID=A0A9P0LFT9_ACAOB|nr:unnamed protein product [Acanthoscelides obtectus]CAK1664949.1 hypothetical protein AOBTE_LOCUS24573 [Acanthoscelides obtectus]
MRTLGCSPFYCSRKILQQSDRKFLMPFLKNAL